MIFELYKVLISYLDNKPIIIVFLYKEKLSNYFPKIFTYLKN